MRLGRFTRVLDGISHVLVVISGIAIALMAIHIVVDVSMRYLFRAPLPGTVAFVSRYYMVFLVFLPLAFVQRRNAHFVAGLFTDWLPARQRERLDGVTAITMAVVAGLMAWCSISSAIYATDNGEQVQAAEFVIPTWPGRWLVPLGLGLMALCALTMGIRRLIGEQPDREASDLAETV
jgi:TRAP-type C4-dicarboxylate transport system permease small subunit